MRRGRVTFREERCKGCGLCISVCPQHILALQEDKTNQKGYHPTGCIDQSKCIACANCGKICPDAVITVERLEDQP